MVYGAIKMAKKKPVKKGAKHSPRNKTSSPTSTQKAKLRARLVVQGVPVTQAQMLSGEMEGITAGAIAARRISWQKTLPKAP